ncbi:hypothetical protein [Chitinophaga sp. HK235]|uniref:hypothetical protein n=1 Tax=Chitinophaga sp. HK235 TaxID=2952571 RepID=UPI001BA92CAF|nr:hypothetical protein [Chitinophaga sp. HK235]
MMYEVDITNRETVVFVNSIRAKNLKGFCWLWFNLPGIIRSVKRHHGAYECIPALVSPLQIVMVSYWLSYRELGEYYKSDWHQRFTQFTTKNPTALGMFFESYAVEKSGRYINGVFGLGKNFRRKM